MVSMQSALLQRSLPIPSLCYKEASASKSPVRDGDRYAEKPRPWKAHASHEFRSYSLKTPSPVSLSGGSPIKSQCRPRLLPSPLLGPRITPSHAASFSQEAMSGKPRRCAATSRSPLGELRAASVSRNSHNSVGSRGNDLPSTDFRTRCTHKTSSSARRPTWSAPGCTRPSSARTCRT